MLELSAGVPFRKQIRDLLQLKGPFKRDREVELPAKEKHAVCIGIFFGNRLNLVAEIQNRFHLGWQRFKRFNHAAPIRSGKISHPAKKQPKQGKNDKLRRKRFRRRDADFRTGVHVNSPVALARNRARDIVTNSQSPKAFAPAFAQGSECIRGFAALADRKDQRLRSHWCIAMTKLTRVFDFGWNISKSLDQIFTDNAGMKRGATTCKDDTADIAKLGRGHVQAAQLCRAFLRVETAAHRVAYCVWLLKDFFEHVMGIIPFSDIFGGKFDFTDRMLAAVSRERSDLEFVASRSDYVEIV